MNNKLLNYSFYLLGRRDYSVKELKKKFIEKEYNLEDIEKVLNYLIENKYQSEERFARSFINSKLNSKIGISKIKSSLIFEKGIDKEIIENILLDIVIDETQQIQKIIENKYRNKNLKDYKEKNKAFKYLVSKGFSFDDINTAFKNINSE